MGAFLVPNLLTVTSVVVSIDMEVCPWCADLFSCEKKPKRTSSLIAVICLHCLQQHGKDTQYSHSHRICCHLVYLKKVILMRMRYTHSVVLICFSLIAKHVEPFHFTYWLLHSLFKIVWFIFSFFDWIIWRFWLTKPHWMGFTGICFQISEELCPLQWASSQLVLIDGRVSVTAWNQVKNGIAHRKRNNESLEMFGRIMDYYTQCNALKC